MTLVLIILVVLVLVIFALAVNRSARAAQPTPGADTTLAHRVLLPFVADALSEHALLTALRLARSDRGTLVPVLLVRIPREHALDSPVPPHSGMPLSLQHAVEDRAHDFNVPVDPHVIGGRTYRHALRRAIGQAHSDQIVMAADLVGNLGFNADDVAWMLNQTAGKLVIVRPQSPIPRSTTAPAAPTAWRQANRNGRRYAEVS